MVPLKLPPPPWTLDPDGYPSSPVVLDANGEPVLQVIQRSGHPQLAHPETDAVARAVVGLPGLVAADPPPDPAADLPAEAGPEEVVCLTCAVYVRVPAGTDPDGLAVSGRVVVTDGVYGLWPADQVDTEAARVVRFDDDDDAGEASDPSPEAACTSSSTSGTGRG